MSDSDSSLRSTPESASRSVTLTREQRPSAVHTSHAETVERHYDRCRAEGIPRETAREIARSAADRNHREWDRRRRDR